LLVLVVFTFALDLAAEHRAAVAPGALWVAYLFGGTLGLGRGFAQEREWGTLEGLLLAPVDRGAIYLAKLLGNAAYMLAIELISLPVFVAFFDLPVLRLELLPVLFLGTLGFAAAGTLFAAMAAHGRSREVLLPVLLFPVAVPVVISCVKATASVIAGEGAGQWLSLLIAFAAVIAVVAYLTFDFVVEDS
jgi:heme exporter protein B